MGNWDYYKTSDRSRSVPKMRSTFMVEALLLLACVIILLAVTITLFAFASETSTKAQRIQESADIAQNSAEQFAANPAGMPEILEVGDYTVRCDVDREETESGLLYNANVIVMYGVEDMCSLEVSKYMPGQRAQGFTPLVDNGAPEDQAAEAVGSTSAEGARS